MSRELGLAFEPADIALTTGAFAAIMVAKSAIRAVGDVRKATIETMLRLRLSRGTVDYIRATLG